MSASWKRCLFWCQFRDFCTFEWSNPMPSGLSKSTWSSPSFFSSPADFWWFRRVTLAPSKLESAAWSSFRVMTSRKLLSVIFKKKLFLCRHSRLLCNYPPAHWVADAMVCELQFVLFQTFPVHTKPRRKGWIMLVEALELHVPSSGAYKTYTIFPDFWSFSLSY